MPCQMKMKQVKKDSLSINQTLHLWTISITAQSRGRQSSQKPIFNILLRGRFSNYLVPSLQIKKKLGWHRKRLRMSHLFNLPKYRFLLSVQSLAAMVRHQKLLKMQNKAHKMIKKSLITVWKRQLRRWFERRHSGATSLGIRISQA